MRPAPLLMLSEARCLQLWNHPGDLAAEVAAERAELPPRLRELVGKGFAGPAVELEGVRLTDAQRAACGGGLDERQIRMLRAQVRRDRGADIREGAILSTHPPRE